MRTSATPPKAPDVATSLAPRRQPLMKSQGRRFFVGCTAIVTGTDGARIHASGRTSASRRDRDRETGLGRRSRMVNRTVCGSPEFGR